MTSSLQTNRNIHQMRKAMLGYSALHFAVAFNRKDVVLMLLMLGANVNINFANSQIKPLHLAYMYNKMKFVKYLYLFSGNDWSAGSNDQIKIIKALLNHKVKVDAHTAL